MRYLFLLLVFCSCTTYHVYMIEQPKEEIIWNHQEPTNWRVSFEKSDTPNLNSIIIGSDWIEYDTTNWLLDENVPKSRYIIINKDTLLLDSLRIGKDYLNNLYLELNNKS